MAKRQALTWKTPLTAEWSGEGDRYVSPRWEWFYRLKAFICWNLNREPHIDLTDNYVTVCYTDGGSYANPGEWTTVYWFEAIVVGYGVFSNWWATVYRDSN